MPKPLPVGVIEAKAESEDPLKGMEQGKRYAACVLPCSTILPPTVIATENSISARRYPMARFRSRTFPVMTN